MIYNQILRSRLGRTVVNTGNCSVLCVTAVVVVTVVVVAIVIVVVVVVVVTAP